MPDYRLYFINQKGCISSPPLIVECDSDEDAIAVGHAQNAGQVLEIWDRDRMVASLPPDAETASGG